MRAFGVMVPSERSKIAGVMPAASALTRKPVRKAANFARSGVGVEGLAVAGAAGGGGAWGAVAQPLKARSATAEAHSGQRRSRGEGACDSGKEKNLTVNLLWRRAHSNTQGKDVNAPVTRLPGVQE